LFPAVWIALIVGVRTTLGAGSAGDAESEQVTAAVCWEPDTATGRTSGIVPDCVVGLEPPTFASNSPLVPDDPVSDIEQATSADSDWVARALVLTSTFTFPNTRYEDPA
jgi:hypothetical protein